MTKMSDNLFADHNERNYAEELIGDGKKYSDIGKAAKALVDKDTFIEQLQKENAAMRSSIKGEEKINELLDRLNKLNTSPNGTGSNEGNQPSENGNGINANTNITQPGLSPEDVLKILDAREKAAAEKRNLEMVVQKTREAFGANSGAVLRQKATDIGMSEEELMGLAKTNPQAFLKLVEATPAGNTTAPKTSVNSAALLKDSNGNLKNNSYWKKVEKDMGRANFYANHKLQNEMMRCAQEMGEAFFT